MKLIFGLGNPGDKYKSTRHNAGFMAVDFLANHFGFESFKWSEKHYADIAEGQIDGEKTMLVKPQTFMNLSGRSVSSLAQFYKIPTEELVVIYDEADLPFGTLRIRQSGSAGGHNGIKSIIQSMGTDAFMRIRLGIQPEKPFPGALEDYVLGKLTEDQSVGLNQTIEKLPELLKTLWKEGVEGAMQKFN